MENTTRATLANLMTYKETPFLIKEEMVKKVAEKVKEIRHAYLFFFRKSHDVTSQGIVLYNPREGSVQARF